MLWSRSRQKQQASTALNHIIHTASDHRAEGPDCRLSDVDGTIRVHGWELFRQVPTILDELIAQHSRHCGKSREAAEARLLLSHTSGPPMTAKQCWFVLGISERWDSCHIDSAILLLRPLLDHFLCPVTHTNWLATQRWIGGLRLVLSICKV